ncbi:MAG: hypothetical protein K0R27_2489 [Xanthobacteraceae bacterium]|jgi:hypothetical protein|nr:hypothetical protein [Xanthobacteraceae bacterium]
MSTLQQSTPSEILILAVEPITGLAFDRAYCRNMKLPFHKGWDHYEVYRREGNNLIFVASHEDYNKAATELLAA